MNRWIVDSEEYSACVEASDGFLRPNVRLPKSVATDGVQVVGFGDECSIRQSPEALACLRTFLSEVGEDCFCVRWMDEAPEIYRKQNGVYPAFICDSLDANDSSSLLSLQLTQSDQEALQYGEWVLTSRTQRWAIYGEHYNSELCVFLCRDSHCASLLASAFPMLVTDPTEVPGELWDGLDNPERLEFEAEFLKNYGI